MTLKLGLVHTPVTPFTRERRIDFERYGRLLEFHLANGAEALALPMHAGESVSLTDAERLESIQFAVTQVKKRVPVVAHVSQSGTALAVDLARGAQKAGADAIIATNPYYWTPKDPMLTEHFTQIGRAVRIPFFVYNAPEDNAGREISLNVALELIQRLDNFAGFVDRSLDWVFMTELVSNCKRARADFQVIGIEYMVPVFVVGATGAFAPLAAVAPKRIREMYELCRKELYLEARRMQEDLAGLFQATRKAKVADLKAALRLLGRDCGDPRGPLKSLGAASRNELQAQLKAMPFMATEPRAW